MKNRRLSFLTLCCLLLALLPVQAAAGETAREGEAMPFTDAASDYEEALRWAAENSIAADVGDAQFAPELGCTRAQAVTFFWRAAGCPVVNYAMDMDDVPEDAYYVEAVRWALSTGVAAGTGAHSFDPGAVCTRAQMVTFLFRYAAPAAVTLQELVSGYADAAAVPGFALPAMNWALAAGILQGDGSCLAPNDGCTRAEAVILLWRALA